MKLMNGNQLTVKSVEFLYELFLVDEDITRCLGSLSKLARHFEEPIVVTGSIATGWHLLKNGGRSQMRRLNDIDVIVDGLSGLRQSLSGDFLIKHFHPHRGQGRILIQLVDEEYRMRVDVFTPTTRTLTNRLIDFAIGEVSCRLVSAEDLAAKLLSVIYPATSGEPVEPKYVEHFHLLSSVADLDVTREVWREYRKEGQSLEFEAAVKAVERSITDNPGLLQAGHYSQNINQTCRWCCESELFPLAQLSKIYEILGYV
jgi:hypothetical protein